MMKPELLPCPFCGGTPYLANVAMTACAYVVCTDCRMQSDDGIVERVVAAWNTRADLAGPVRVKPLEWEVSFGVYRASSTFGDYLVVGKILTIPIAMRPQMVLETPEAAKAAAQADYEARILAALEPAKGGGL